MKTRTLIFLGLLLAISWWSMANACGKTHPLFEIERSKNGNVVHYDACLTQDNKLSDSQAVSVYWVLKNGEREDLNDAERKYAYGIESEKPIGSDKSEIVVTALKDRKMTVEKIDGAYRVVVSIDGKESLLEKVYVQSEDRLLGLPKIIYVDVFGLALKDKTPVKERIVPKG